MRKLPGPKTNGTLRSTHLSSEILSHQGSLETRPQSPQVPLRGAPPAPRPPPLPSSDFTYSVSWRLAERSFVTTHRTSTHSSSSQQKKPRQAGRHSASPDYWPLTTLTVRRGWRGNWVASHSAIDYHQNFQASTDQDGDPTLPPRSPNWKRGRFG